MSKITILQTDNRLKLDYLLLSQNVNKKACDYLNLQGDLNYNYVFIELNSEKYKDIHPTTAKIYIVNDFLQKSSNDLQKSSDDLQKSSNDLQKSSNDLQKSSDDILIFLDSDAWVQNCHCLNKIINMLINDSTKHGCYSRDPYIKKNTYVNSGSFIIKNNEYTKNMYQQIVDSLENDKENSHYKNSWPYDQFYISRYIFNNKNDFNIFIPEILNTPLGLVFRHNWFKTPQMYTDLHNLINEPTKLQQIIHLDFENCHDKKDFPNKEEYGYQYYV